MKTTNADAVVLSCAQADTLQRLVRAATAICPREPPPFKSDEETITRWHASFRTSTMLIERLAAVLRDASRDGTLATLERADCSHPVTVEHGGTKSCRQCGRTVL